MTRKNSRTLQRLGERLSAAKGRQYWRSLDELVGTPEFLRYLEHEFPESAGQCHDRDGRRKFLQLMAASLALGGLSGCAPKKAEDIVPYVRQPEEMVPGKPLFFATTAPVHGYGVGVVVESHMGRPTKIEGNSLHPASLGGTSAQTQASLLDLYDPDRSQTVTYRRQVLTWDSFLTRVKPQIDEFRRTNGEGLRILLSSTTSPTLLAQLARLLDAYPRARVDQFDAVDLGNDRRGAEMAFGRPLIPIYDFRRADVVLSLDSDFLGVGPGQVRYAREFADRRCVAEYRESASAETMSRVYALESTPTLTGAKADHRYPLAPLQIIQFVRQLAAELNVPGVTNDSGGQTLPATWHSAVVNDLKSYRTRLGGSAVVVAGPWQPPAVHALVHAINVRLGAVGVAVRYCNPFDAAHAVDVGSVNVGSVDQLIDEMQHGDVKGLVVLDANPAYAAVDAANFAQSIAKIPLTIHLGSYDDETAIACDWHIPALHYLESWGDLRAYDGTVSIQQPLIAPLYDGRTSYELLAALTGEVGKTTRQLVRDHWSISLDDRVSEDRWQTWLHDGVVADSAAESVPVELDADRLNQIDGFQSDQNDDLTLVLRPDPSVDGGQFANNAWLQELPKPFTKLTWENAALVGPSTAQELRLKNGHVVRVSTESGEVALPVWILPGQAKGVIAIHLGYGRSRAGRIGTGIGTNAYVLRQESELWSIPARITLTRERHALASTQNHFVLDGRDLIRSGTTEQLQANPQHPGFVGLHHAPSEASLLPEIAYDGYKWGMVIDLNACTGCNACVVACQSENNIPVVGQEQVLKGREMHWLRIDTYYGDTPDNPTTHFQPLPCMHCEKAPCELVCPVAATTHSPSGINEMTYNRCVGTRYCSNNCPYKVRRFNFLHYNESLNESPILQLLQNPDVTVRSRGVMEKCTYCVQRVNAARIDAEKEGRRIEDGEVVSACQAACPAQAIQFGDLNDANSKIAKAHQSPLRYALLEELNTQPRTTYLAEVRNPNPDLATKGGGHHE